MSAILIYLLKVAAIQIILLICYWALLRRDTFFSMARWYFIGGLILSFIIPFIHVNVGSLETANVSDALTTVIILINGNDLSQEVLPSFSYTFSDYMMLAIAIGIAFMLVRFILQCVALKKLRTNHFREVNGYSVRSVEGSIKPFSFGNRIYLNPQQYNEHELEEIIEHELVHVSQQHSIDIILGLLNKCLFWWNPATWLLVGAMRNNLEYIVDKEMLKQGFDRKYYQYHLLHISRLAYSNSIANHFNLSNLKKRIKMMNKKQTHPFHKMKWLLLVPVATVVLLVFSLSSEKAIASPTAIEEVMAKVDNDADTTKKEVVIISTDGKGKSTAVVSLSDNQDKSKPARVLVRSVNTSDPENQPLFLIDGKEVTDSELKDLDVSTIQSINVLKGEGSAKEFGEKGKNGVVQIYVNQQDPNHKSNTSAKMIASDRVISVDSPNRIHFSDDTDLEVYIDGRKVKPVELNTLSTDSIRSMMVKKDSVGQKNAIYIFLK